MDVISAKDAKTAGLPTYFTGKPCKHGHIAERYVANWTCVVCHAKTCAKNLPKWRAKNPEKNKEYSLKYAEAHAISSKAWRQRNKERCLQTQLEWNRNNKALRNFLSSKWRKQNRGKMNALKIKRISDTMRRTPVWLTDDELWMIKQAYELAALRSKTTGVDWHVDHVVPLRGKFVSGLHTPYNLQVIPAIVNLRKGNRYATREIDQQTSIP